MNWDAASFGMLLYPFFIFFRERQKEKNSWVRNHMILSRFRVSKSIDPHSPWEELLLIETLHLFLSQHYKLQQVMYFNFPKQKTLPNVINPSQFLYFLHHIFLLYYNSKLALSPKNKEIIADSHFSTPAIHNSCSTSWETGLQPQALHHIHPPFFYKSVIPPPPPPLQPSNPHFEAPHPPLASVQLYSLASSQKQCQSIDIFSLSAWQLKA